MCNCRKKLITVQPPVSGATSQPAVPRPQPVATARPALAVKKAVTPGTIMATYTPATSYSSKRVYLDIWGNVRPSTVTPVVREIAPTATATATATTEAKKAPTSETKKEKEKAPTTRSFLDLFSRN